jgi:hypothetical protein
MQEVMDDINLFSVITILSFLLSCPLMLLAEGVKFTPGYLQSTVSIFRIDKNIFITFGFENSAAAWLPNRELTIISCRRAGTEPPRTLRQSSTCRLLLPWLSEGEQINHIHYLITLS